MIKPSELRIGNWVEHKRYADKVGEIRKVFGIVSGFQLHVVYFDSHSNEHSVTHFLEGIPITPETLGKLTEYEVSKINVMLVNNQFKDGRLVFSINGYWQSLEYVHQLQNLYFVLTKEELAINF